MTECQGCGAWNDTSRTLCVLCGTPLAEIDEWDAAAELPPLPPLPDGGLRASMPSWLREPPTPTSSSVCRSSDPDLALEQVADLASLGPRADPRTFLSDDDFPQWLRDLAVRRRETASPHGAPPLGAVSAARHAPGTELAARSASASPPSQPRRRFPSPDPIWRRPCRARPSLIPAPPAASDPPEERRGRDVWETLLLSSSSSGSSPPRCGHSSPTASSAPGRS